MSLKVTVASVSMPAIKETASYAERNAERLDIDFRIFILNSGTNTEAVSASIKESDLILVDTMGLDSRISKPIQKSMKKCKGSRISIGGMSAPLSRLGGYDEAAFKMDEDAEKDISTFFQCWKQADRSRIEWIFDTVFSKYFGKDVQPADLESFLFGANIRHPSTCRSYPDLESYRADYPRTKPFSVALFYGGHSYPTDNSKVDNALFDRISEFADVIPVAMSGFTVEDIGDLRRLIGVPDATINLMPFRFLSGPAGGDIGKAVEFLKETDGIYLSPFTMRGTSRETWENSIPGVSPMEFMIYIFLPELDGAIVDIPIGSEEKGASFERYGLDTTEMVPIEERIDRIAGKLKGYLSLRQKPNSEKKVAFINYNYPPGEGGLFGGSFNNGAGSLSNILSILKEAGYTTDEMTPDEILETFVNNGLVNNGKWISPSDRMIRYKSKIPEYRTVTDTFGRQPGKVMTVRGEYMIPGLQVGNVFIGVQPGRGSGSDDVVKTYHDKAIPPHNQYVAFYQWLRDEFKADAIVHVGTHGTVEFLPGKEQAMSGSCFPDIMLGDVPHIYIYETGNCSEAMIAKRRSGAELVSYMPAVMVRSDLYGDMAKLSDSIAEYRESAKADKGRADALLQEIVEKAREMRLPEEIDALEDELLDMKQSLIPRGLHAFGTAYDEESADIYAAAAMEFPQEGVKPLSEVLPGSTPEDREALYKEFNRTGEFPPAVKGNADAEDNFLRQKELRTRSMTNDEARNLVRALEGRYIDAKPGGDPFKDPDVFPSGHNIVQFNPDKVPTFAAFERGKQAADEMIAQYLEEFGEYPRSAAMVLWGLETSRTQGMSIGQILGYLGLRMVADNGDFPERFEVIPLEELGRPRIDVSISICGFFRDMFMNVISGLQAIFETVSGLDEPDEMNYCKADTRKNREYLEENGIATEDIEGLSAARIFGPPNGVYATTLTGRVGGSSWKDEKELGDAFASNMRFAYTGKTSTAIDSKGLVSNNHSNVDMVSQVRDSSDREMIDLDHYYEFMGGLSKSVEISRGDRGKAAMFVVDGSKPKVRTMTLERSLEHGIRTRLLNPKWIDGLLEVKYHGAAQINDRFENVLGFAATTGQVSSGAFSDMSKTYIEDEEMRQRMRENNNWAYMDILARMSEAYQRGYWQATDEELEALKQAFAESEEIAEADTDDLQTR